MTPLAFACLFVAALSPSLAWSERAAAQAPSRPAATLSAAQAERNAIDLRQGMSLEEVQKLLGKPRRTALRASGSSAAQAQGTLQWTYSWPSASSAQGNLRVEFGATAPEKWLVNSWEWSSY